MARRNWERRLEPAATGPITKKENRTNYYFKIMYLVTLKIPLGTSEKGLWGNITSYINTLFCINSIVTTQRIT